jgi:GAF domain-containing protein
MDARAKVTGRDEISTLARTMNGMTARLRGLIQSLEQRVMDRTAALEAASANASRRAAQFEAITQVTRAIGSLRNMDELMPWSWQIVANTSTSLRASSLNDEHNQFAWLIAANSEGGRRMLARRHSLKIGEQGIVGYVASRGESRVARNVGEDAVFFNNPDLPETKSEAALPLRRGAEIAGVLDVQSTREDAFSDEDLSILAVLADQVANGIFRLFETTRRSPQEAETLYWQYIQDDDAHAGRQYVLGYRHTRGAVALTPSELPSIDHRGQ